MLAHVEKKNSRNEGARLTADEAEKLKLPLPAIGKEHKRQHKQTRPKSSKDSKIAKASIQDANVDDNIADDIAAPEVNSHGLKVNTQWQTQAQSFEHNDMDEFEDIDDIFVYQSLGDQQVDAMKQRLIGGQGYKSTDKYIEGDSYPDTTSGRLTDLDLADILEDQPVLALQQTTETSMPRTRSAPNGVAYDKQHIQDAQQRNETMPSFGQSQSFFKRSDERHDAAPAFQMSALRRGDSSRTPAVAQPVPINTRQNRPSTQAHLYQRARAPIEDAATAKSVRGTRFKETHMPTGAEMPLPDNSNVRMQQRFHTLPVQAPAQLDIHDLDLDAAERDVLDYDLDTLQAIEYKQLREEPFDHDPHGEQSPAVPDVPLSAKLDSLSALSPEEWPSFFYSLDLDKWEEAGDWFIEQYSSKLARLKDHRRQRRNAAQAFEVEIEKRQQAVVNKRITIRNTMSSMRAHGAQVLITPVKSTQ